MRDGHSACLAVGRYRISTTSGDSTIARDNPRAASRIATTLLEVVERLAELPGLGRPGRVTGTRELIVPGTPYIVPYGLRGDRLEVIAVFHVRQKWPRQL